ncbi:MAG: GDP-L-fucose synthase [Bdellovibrionaceae bacterium]|nr:GDP-L-fucose synthase [Pseudobdellovibrionaceae bacterium]
MTGARGMVGQNLLECPGLGVHEWLTPDRRELDLRDQASVVRWLKEHKPEMILHAAGRVGGIQANIESPVEFLIENLDLGRNILMGAYEAGIERVLNLGSTCMYPRAAVNPLREDMVLQGALEPTNEGYALAKVMTQRLGAYLNREYGTRYKTLIPCNLYGRWDKFDPERSHLVPAVLRKLHEAKTKASPTVEIWGAGTARREFMDAADLADFMIQAISRYDELPDLMNVGLGYDFEINEYYYEGAKVVGYTGAFQHNLSKPVGMQQKLADVQRLRQFGWTAPTTLATGMARAYEFYLNQNRGLE